jgi:hypothetical protein
VKHRGLIAPYINGGDSRRGAMGDTGRRPAVRLCCGAGEGAGGRGKGRHVGPVGQ